jgi:hypothetical protein
MSGSTGTTGTAGPLAVHTPSRWRGFTLRLLAVCVLGVLVGAAWVALIRAPERPLTSNGARVTNADATLRGAEAIMRQQARDRHGRLGHGARCYFTSRATAGLDQNVPLPVGDQLLCGPVVFVDGDPGRPYLTFSLAGSPTGTGLVSLSVSGPEPGTVSAAAPAGFRLVRPDGEQPPGTERLLPPAPPPAVGDVLTTSSTLRSPLTTAAAGARMIGQLSGVRLVEYGFVARYGWGDQARTAPAGYRLLAFATVPLPGELGTESPNLSVSVDGRQRGPLADTSDYVVTAVPARARQVDLVLTDSGLQQSISLLTGQPGPQNPQLAARSHTTADLAASRAIRVRLQTSAGAGTLTGTLMVRRVALTYWAANGNQCSRPDRAWLHVAAVVRLDGDRQAYGAEAALLQVTLPGGARLAAVNGAADPATQVDDVVDVPASLTSASLTYTGSVRTGRGTLTVLTPITLPFTILAG